MFHTKNIRNRMMSLGLLASLGFVALLCGAAPTLAATAPSLGTASTYGIVSSTYTNISNVAPTTIITGTPSQPAVCYTTAPVLPPTTITGTTVVPCDPAVGVDQGLALADLNAQCLDVSCTSIPAGTPMDAVVVGANPPGTFPPGCYRFLGALDITASTTVTLNGAGVYVFCSVGALTTGANSGIALAGGVCGNDVFWAPGGAANIGAFTIGGVPAAAPTFVGNIIDNAGITIGHFANLSGRALDFATTVTTDANTITVPTCVPFVPGGGPAIVKVFSPATINAGGGAGGVSTLTFTLSNANSSAVTNVSFTDTYPAGLVNATPPNVAGNCSGGTVLAADGGNTIGLSGVTIAASSSCTISVNVITSDSQLSDCFINESGVVSSDQGPGISSSATLCAVAVAPEPPMPLLISQVLSPSVISGTAISDIATLTGITPTGTITFNLYGPDDATCTGIPAFTSQVTVTGNGNYFSGSFTPVTVGTYRWIVNYGGDTNNAATTNGCNALNENVVVTPIPALASTAVPTLNEWGVIFFMVFAGLGSIYYLRKYRRV
jgi:uncharacterized repeat protein (TIGR01451 family)